MISKFPLVALLPVVGALLVNPVFAAAPATASAPATATAPAAKTLAVTDADNGKTFKLGDATTVTITLPGNATTGYSWSVTKIEGTALEQAGSVQYLPARAQANVAGSGGTFVATFHPLKAGETVLTLGYARAFENGTPPAKTFTVTLVVEKAPATAPKPAP